MRLTTWLGRAIALACAATLLPGLALAWQQVGDLHPVWLGIIGGGIVAVSLVMPLYAWRDLPLRALTGAYAALVLLGILTFPLAWTSARPLAGTPWLWACVGVAGVCAAVASSVRWGIGYAVVAGFAFGVVRLTPAGGAAPWGLAAQDALELIVLPAATLLVLASFLKATEALVGQTRHSERVEADALVQRALADQRRMLDGIIHDDVMTALVAAGHASRPPQELRGLAGRALAALDRAALPAEAEQPVTAAQFGRLLRDMIEQVAPDAVVRLHPGQGRGWEVSPLVASLIGQAAREAALNAQKHAGADRIEVDLRPGNRDGVPQLVLEIADDGAGFDPAAVPAQRLGLRVSISERMHLIGGTATIESAPGQGTRVTLCWRDAAAATTTPQPGPVALRAVQRHLRVASYLVPIWLVTAVQGALGLATIAVGAKPEGVVLALGLSLVATFLATLDSRAADRLDPWAAVVVVVLLTAASWLVDSGLPEGGRPGHAGWHVTVVQVLLIVLMVRGQARWALIGLGLFVAESLRWVVMERLGPAEFVLSVFGPILWVVLSALLLRALDRIGREISEARSGTREASWSMASTFSKLVLREVWLNQLRAQVEPLLARLADPDHELSQPERDACRAAEGRLRDELRAGNLVSQTVADAIETARARGVEVVLVDNRGSKLPGDVRRATLRRLEELVSGASGGRIVARTAPEGADAAVTILSVAPGGSPELTTIDAHGEVQVRRP